MEMRDLCSTLPLFYTYTVYERAGKRENEQIMLFFWIAQSNRQMECTVEYEIYWRVISPDRQKISPSDVLFSNSDISVTNVGTKKVLMFSENLGS